MPPEPQSPEQRAEPEESVGQALSRARLAAHLTVEEVSEQTRIRAPLVLAVEGDDFARCGGDVYARGHIRSIAHVVGADPAALTARYDATHAEPDSATSSRIFESDGVRLERRRPGWAPVMVAAIVVAVGFVAFSVLRGGGAESSSTVSQEHKHATPSASASHGGEARPSRSAVAGAPADRVTLKITVTGDRSWVQVKDAHQKKLYAHVLEQGQSKTFTQSQRLRVTVGNAGAVKLFVNGKDLGAPGKAGQIKRLSFTPGDPEAG